MPWAPILSMNWNSQALEKKKKKKKNNERNPKIYSA